MFDFIRKLFKRDAASSPETAPMSQLPPSVIEDGIQDQILSVCRDIAALLHIELPQFKFYGLIFTSQGMVQCQFNFDEVLLPPDTEPHGAYYFDDRNLVVISTNIPKLARKGKGFIYRYEKATIAEMIFTCCHELRHVWQRKYHTEEYYGHNAVGDEVINDIAEVDADAFALAYIFSNTAYRVNDLPTQLQQVGLQATLDNGKRWKRARQLYKDYGFGDSADIAKLRNQVNITYADLLRLFAKGRIC